MMISRFCKVIQFKRVLGVIRCIQIMAYSRYIGGTCIFVA